MFSLDYQTMQQTLQRMCYTGSIEASIPSGIFAKGTVFLEVQKGMIQSWMVITRQGRQVNDTTKIVEELTRAGLLEWRLTTESKYPAQPGPALSSPTSMQGSKPQPSTNPLASSMLSATSYPQRLASDASWIGSWPSSHRQVYALSTGHYSEQDIARILRCSPLDLLTILRELENMGALQRKNSRGD